jgi:hypothetical protein
MTSRIRYADLDGVKVDGAFLVIKNLVVVRLDGDSLAGH